MNTRRTRRGTRRMKGGNDNNDNDNDNDNNDNGNNNNGNNNNNNNNNNMDGGKRKTNKKSRSSTMMNENIPAVGSKAQVWHGTAKHTSGGLTKAKLMKTKKGRIVSKAKHALGKKALKNLVKAGYKAKKGTFKVFRK